MIHDPKRLNQSAVSARWGPDTAYDHAAASRAKPAPDAGPWACEARYQGLPLGFILSGGEASDYAAAEPLVEIPIAATKTLLADNG